jgi:biopolymer transport protein ExbB
MYGNGYRYRRWVTFDHTKVSGDADLSNFVALFSGTYAWLATVANGGRVQDANGADIRFETAAGVKLAHEVQSYDPATGSVVLWVLIPVLAGAADTAIYIYYGKAGLVSPEADKTATWAGYDLVVHFEQDPGNASPQFLNSGPAAGSLYGWNMVSGDWIAGAGYTGKAVRTNGSNKSIQSNSLNLGSASTPTTLSLWLRRQSDDTASHGMLVQSASSPRVYLDHTGSLNWRFYNGAYRTVTLSRSDYAPIGTWVFLQLSFADAGPDTRARVLRDDGTFKTETIIAGQLRVAASGAVLVGKSSSSYSQIDVDEVRLCQMERSFDWGITEYRNQSSPSTFYGVGDEIEAPPLPPGRPLRSTLGLAI